MRGVPTAEARAPQPAPPLPAADALRVLIAEDSVLLRDSLASLLADRGFAVVGAVGTAHELLVAVERRRPDVALIDIRMPPSQTDEGLRAAEVIRGRHPGVGTLVLSQYLDVRFAMRLLNHGPQGGGYLLKGRISDIRTLVRAVETIGRGGSFVDRDIVATLMRRRAGSGALGTLTEREVDILALMAEGRSNLGLCQRLHLSPKTVESHVRSIFLKLDLPPAADDHRRVLAVLRYLQSRDCPVSPP